MHRMPSLCPRTRSAGRHWRSKSAARQAQNDDVVSTLRAAGHEVHPLGVGDELKPVRDGIEGFKPHVAFTLLEKYHGDVIYDQNVASYLELMQVPYTGCNPRGRLLARCKDLSKTLAHYRRIPVPAFAVFPMQFCWSGGPRVSRCR